MKAKTVRALRQVHLYLGMFFAPAILFFATTGMLMTFDFHEARSAPPRWLVVLANYHKKQAPPRPRPAAARPEGAPRREAAATPRPEGARANPFPLKVFVGLMALGLIGSTLLGIWIALTMRAGRAGALVSLGVGALVPLLLVLA